MLEDNLDFCVSTSTLISKILDPLFEIYTKQKLYDALDLDRYEFLMFKKISLDQYQTKYDKIVKTNGFPNSVIFELLYEDKIYSCKIFSAEKDYNKKGTLHLLGIKTIKQLIDILKMIYQIFDCEWKDEYLNYTCSLINKSYKHPYKLNLQHIISYITNNYDKTFCNACWEPQKYQTINISIYSPNVTIFIYQTGSIDIRAKKQDATINNIKYAYKFINDILDTQQFNIIQIELEPEPETSQPETSLIQPKKKGRKPKQTQTI